MADITEYLDGLNYTITAEEKLLMDIFAEAWEYCRNKVCRTCKYGGKGDKHIKMMICMSYQYAKRLIAAGYRNVTPPAECKDDELITAAYGVYPDTLTDREKHIVVLRQGLSNGIKRTFEDIGREYGVTRERIRQLEKKALDKLVALKAMTADGALVVHGKWAGTVCTACGESVGAAALPCNCFYCPNCGAKMDGGGA